VDGGGTVDRDALRLGVTIVAGTIGEVRAVAQAAESAGFWGFGLGDSPARFTDLAVGLTTSLLATERLTVGSTVTNPRTRPWSVLAAMARDLTEIAPDRFFLGLSSGNSAIRAGTGPSASPAPARELAEVIPRIRAACPVPPDIMVAADGLRMAGVAGEVADAMIVGTGVDAQAVAAIIGAAAAARPADWAPVQPWLYLHVNVVDDEADLDRARGESVAMAITFAHRAFARTFTAKHVPLEFQAVLEERLAGYDMAGHARTGPAGAGNAAMFRDRPDIEDYLLDRFAIYGTAQMCREQLARAAETAGVTRIWLSTIVADPVANVYRAGDAFSSIMEAPLTRSAHA